MKERNEGDVYKRQRRILARERAHVRVSRCVDHTFHTNRLPSALIFDYYSINFSVPFCHTRHLCRIQQRHAFLQQ